MNTTNIYCLFYFILCTDAGFQVRGGGGALKKIAPSGGRRENFWGISCEKSRLYAKKKSCFPILGRAGCFFFHFFSMLLNGAYASKFETGWEP
jgi:hypothetical protein